MTDFILTPENYYSKEANNHYWSASLVKTFLDCPARAVAELRGEYERPKSQALLVGGYVDAFIEGAKSFGAYCETHKNDIYKRDGKPRAEYAQADEMLQRALSDPVWADYMVGDKQKILTGEIAGIPFKAKLDVFLEGQRIVDLKTVRDFQPVYIPGEGKVTFADAWHWPLQLAIYQRLEGHNLPCYLACITKESPPDIAIVEIPQEILDAEMAVLEDKLPLFDAYKIGAIEPPRCGKCAYCRQSRKLSGPVPLTSFGAI